ncbi:MAG: tetratricopeptide repeat protein [Candidatus Hodarchaeota archaeon]
MSYSEPKELINAEKLIEEGKIEEALQLLNDFGKKKDLSYHERISYYTLKSLVAFYFLDRNECTKYAEMAYQESHKLENSLLLLDVYIQMAFSLLFSSKPREASEFIKKSEDLKRILPQELSPELKKRKAYILWCKGVTHHLKGDLEKAKDFREEALTILKELDLKLDIANILYQLGGVSWQIGDLNSALEYTEASKILCTNLNWTYFLHLCYQQFGNIYALKGELDLALSYFEQVLAFAEKENVLRLKSSMYNNIGILYQEKGDYDRALENIEKSIAIAEEYGNNYGKFLNTDSLFHLALDMNDLEKAQQYLNRMKQIADQENLRRFNIAYNINRAVFLKNSLRALNRGKAEEMLKQSIEEGIPEYEFLKMALLNLCDLLLFELRATNDTEILDELQTYISQLFDAVKNSRSYSLLAETYLLQARLSLITLDMIKTRQFLTKAQEIAEKYGLDLLAKKISSEHDELLKQLEMWEKLKESKAPLAERIELSRLNEQMERMVRKRLIKLPKLEAEQPVLLTVMSKEGKVLFSNPFTADITIDSAFFSEFLSSCNTFCDQILSESFDRVKFGQHTVLITAVDSFSVCYMFQGQSYTARQKLLHFAEAVKKEPNIMKILQEAINKNVEIKVNKTASLEELIYESFLSDPQQFQMPFKAYEGDGPFVFVSYSHTDRLQVYPIIDYLNRTGINIWYDEGIPVSEDWKSSIVDNLERCSAFLVFITPHIIDSEYVRKEISFALKKQKPFFSVYLKETQLPSKLEFEIGDIQFMNKYLIPETEFYNKLNRMLDPVLNK